MKGRHGKGFSKIPQPQEKAEASHQNGNLASVKTVVPFSIVLKTPSAQTMDAFN